MSDEGTRLEVEEQGNARVVRLPPRLSGHTESAMAAATEDALGTPTGLLVLDFSRVRTTDSAGVGLLFQLLQHARGRNVPVALAALSDQPRMVLERVRLDRYVPIFASVDDAVTSTPPLDSSES